MDWRTAQMIRKADAAILARELQHVRSISLALLAAYETADALQVPQQDEFNLPLWELGHIAWFQQWWVGRNQQREQGAACEPAHERLPCLHLQAAQHGDDWYNSSSVPHALRWQLPLLKSHEVREYLQATLAQTLQCLAQAGDDDASLYFYRLVLLHEAMHVEAGVYMAQALQLPFALPNAMNSVAASAYPAGAAATFSFEKQRFLLGSESSGFVFDNELGVQEIQLDAFEMDARPVSWAQYLRFVESTGYALPRYLSCSAEGAYEACYFGQWQALDMTHSAVHLSWHDAQAYCLWAGRRLPTEAEWECAALTQPAMHWGDVWEWTASDFTPYPGFVPHPYRDYSAPWFGSRKVLRGGGPATLAMMKHPRYRNFFTPERSDIHTGFRTCALA